jgi:Zn-dependent protease
VSAIVAFVGLLLLLASGYFPSVLPNQQERTYWSVAFISTLFLFLSTIMHELGHSLVARARGVAVSSITLVFFGGSSDIRRTDERPLDELLIAVSGPGASLLFALTIVGIRMALPPPGSTWTTDPMPLMIFLESTILLNLWLAGFNLLPTLPLDGGRALRGLLWLGTGDYRKATRIASIVGQTIAAALFLGGAALFVLTLDVTRNPMPSIFGFDSRMIALIALLIAWFVNNSARAAYRQVVLEGRFVGVNVEQIMTTEPGTVTPWTSLEEVVTQHFLQRGERAVAVIRDERSFMGLVAYSDVRKIPRDAWGTRAAGEVMTPATRVLSVTPDDGIDLAIRHMAERHLNQLPVLVEGKLVGMVTRANVLHFLELDDRRRS